MILVTGAGGTVGSALLDELSALGHQPRRAFHSPAKTALASADGLDAVTIDFGQPDTLPAAMAGVQTVFLLGTSGPSQPEHEGNMVAAARAAGVRRIVKLSAWRADEDLTPIGRFHHASEQAVRTSGLAWTFLRPNFYLQNFTRRLAASIRDTGGFAQLASDAPIAFVDARDVAAVAARVLVEPGHDEQAYELTGPAALTYAEAATAIGKVLGQPVVFRGLTAAQARAEMLADGIPAGFADILLEVSLAYQHGGADRLTTTVKDLTGREPISLERFVQDHREAFA
ncbi:NAD(P)H-binding protein [Fodinicola feengrottensis]